MSGGFPWPITMRLWNTYFLSTSSMRAGSQRVCGWLWPRRRSTSCLRAPSSRLRAATSFSSRQLSLSATLIVSGSPANADSFMESSTDSSQASRLPRAWRTLTAYGEQKWEWTIRLLVRKVFLLWFSSDLARSENSHAQKRTTITLANGSALLWPTCFVIKDSGFPTKSSIWICSLFPTSDQIIWKHNLYSLDKPS